jgi:ATP-dependent Zn protease
MPRVGGKILISRSTAGEIRANFLRRGLHQSLEIWLSKPKEKLHEFFEIARHQAPAVLVIDNPDALATDRRALRSSVGHTLINQALAELDRETPKNESVLVIGGDERALASRLRLSPVGPLRASHLRPARSRRPAIPTSVLVPAALPLK